MRVWYTISNQTFFTEKVCPSGRRPFARGEQTGGPGLNIGGILMNKEIPTALLEKAQETAKELGGKTEKILFIVVGDLTADSHYGTSLLAVTEKRAFSLDGTGELLFHTAHTDTEDAKVRRMYGNARLVVTKKNGEVVELMRFTYTVASLCDMAADYILAVASGEDPARAYAAVEETYDKLMLYCPKCGRRLLHPGADCINCQSKDKTLGKLAKYLVPELPNLFLCVVLSLITTALTLIPPTATSTLVDDVLPNRDLAGLYRIVAVLLGSYILRCVIGIVRSYRLRVSGDHVVYALRNDVFAKAQRLSMRFYDKTSTGSVINRISGDTSTIQSFMLRITQEVVVEFFTLVGIVVIMFAMNYKLALLTLIPIPFVVVGTKIFGKKIKPFYRRIWRKWVAVTSVLTDSLPGIRVIKAFSAEGRSGESFKDYNTAWLEVDKKSARISTAFPTIVNFFVLCGSLLIWGIGGKWVVSGDGSLSVGTLVAFISYASMFYTPVNFFANLNDSYQSALSSAERVLDILDAEDEPDLGRGNCPEIRGKIEFKNVNFSFDRTKMTLSDINLTIEPGDVVGIVGTTGSGKSTLVNLLMRFYDGYDGDILVDGVNIRDIDLSYYRSQIGYVQQESMMFRDTVFNNIAFSKPDATVEEVFHAAEVANAHEFIARLPDGYDAMLGERGVGLSGGEKQRLSIARTVLMNPRMLIFDEATASVDSETESQIQGAIEALISGRTTIMIAHRLSTLRKANKIVVLDKGKILEMGTPEELMAAKGKYYKLIQIQTMAEKAQASREEEGFAE